MGNKLLSNKSNLLHHLLNLLESSESVIIYSAFIKDNFLKQIVRSSKGTIKQIVVRWQLEDLVSGVSDIEIFHTCRENNIVLYRNPLLHAKCIINERGDCILGSANFTSKGMIKSEHSNWEVNTKVHQVDFESRIMLQSILLESELITEEWIKEIEKKLSEKIIDRTKIEFPVFSDQRFLISSLPMCNHPLLLWEIIHEGRIVPNIELNSASHDIALYKLENFNGTKEVFLENLKQAFNSHPFVASLIDYIKLNKSCRYGSIVNWIKQNCTEVPTPRSWQIKERLIVNILYEWISFFNNNISYQRKYPHGSDLIIYNC